MNQTDHYGFPYPECDPPLVKDASDIHQFADFALAVDSEVERIDNEANDALVSPDGAVLLRVGAAVAFNDGDTLTYTNVDYDNTGGAVPSLADSRMTVRQSGFYYVAGFAMSTSANSVMGLVFQINGMAGVRHNQASNGSALITAQVSCQEVMRLEAGDFVSMQFRGLDGSTLTFVGLSLYRIV